MNAQLVALRHAATAVAAAVIAALVAAGSTDTTAGAMGSAKHIREDPAVVLELWAGI